MNFILEENPWDRALEELAENTTVSALELLTLLEEADEAEAELFLDGLAQKHITIDISTLPKLAGGAAAVRLQQEEKLLRQGSLLTTLDENDPLRLYLEEIAQLPAEPTENMDMQSFTDAMLRNTAKLAQEYVGRGVLLLDLIQEANLGLWQGVQVETDDRVAACTWWSHHYLCRAVLLQAKASGTGQKLRQAMEDYRTIDEKLLAELGRNPTVEELAEGLHMTVAETEAVAEMLENVQMMHRIKAPKKEELPQEEDQAVEDTAYFQMRQRISELLSVLEPQQAQLLTLRYGLEGGVPMKPEQVAQKLGMTVEQVVAAEAAALSQLRTENY